MRKILKNKRIKQRKNSKRQRQIKRYLKHFNYISMYEEKADYEVLYIGETFERRNIHNEVWVGAVKNKLYHCNLLRIDADEGRKYYKLIDESGKENLYYAGKISEHNMNRAYKYMSSHNFDDDEICDFESTFIGETCEYAICGKKYRCIGKYFYKSLNATRLFIIDESERGGHIYWALGNDDEGVLKFTNELPKIPINSNLCLEYISLEWW